MENNKDDTQTSLEKKKPIKTWLLLSILGIVTTIIAFLFYINSTMDTVYYMEDRNNICSETGRSSATSREVEVPIKKENVQAYLERIDRIDRCTERKYKWQIL